MADFKGWHPILCAIENPLGVWTMKSGTDGEVTKTTFGTVRLVRRGAEVRYRVELDGGIIGYRTTLRAAAEAAWEGSIELARWRRSQVTYPTGQRERWPGYLA